jgi:hypothetical protein
MSTFRRDMIVLYSIVAVTTVGAVALLVATTAKPRPGCRDLVQQRVAAPDSAHEAIAWSDDCGWASKGLTMVAIGKVGAQPRGLAQAMIVMDPDGLHLLADKGEPPRVEVRWAGSDTLVVRYPRLAKPVQRNAEAGGVRIRYEPAP